ncbi:MAG: GNAT family N-acetyltransferase [Candidatus Chloroheliales bacterium]|nr:MAG: GNAT family N-acetyltransferase [Chloroflexota bacterium]
MRQQQLSDIELARMQADALYVHDANGRLVRVNEPDPDDPAPRFFLARTRAGNLWRTRFDLPAYLTAELERLAADEPVVIDLHEPPYHMAEYRGLLEQHAPISNIDAGPAYSLPELRGRVQPAPTIPLVTIAAENATLLQAHYPYTLSRLAELGPVVVVVDGGVAVAACYCARITAQVAEAGVYTVEAYRGRGYAAETVRGWATGIRATGRLPLYSTSWANIASQTVATKLGAVQYGADFSIT